jgi:hypothetical protein
VKKALGLSFFDSINEITRLLDPIWKEFDYIIAVDGRYSNYEADHDFSNDGSYELIEQRYPNAIMDRCCAFQPYKRQRYLDIAGKLNCDYLVVLDTDEYIHPDFQDWPLFWKNLEKAAQSGHKVFKVKMWIPPEWKKARNIARTNTWKSYIRIHKDPGSQRYCTDYHYYWCDKDTTDEEIIKGGLVYQAFFRAIDGVRFTCDSLLRTPEQLQTREEFAFRNIHDERRREYYQRCDWQYNMKHDPLNENELFHYGKKGKILGKKLIDNQ